jgi:hypothetical protein
MPVDCLKADEDCRLARPIGAPFGENRPSGLKCLRSKSISGGIQSMTQVTITSSYSVKKYHIDTESRDE